MALFRVANNRAQFDAAGLEQSDKYASGICFTQSGNARVTTAAPTHYNQGIPMSQDGQVAIVDATAGLPSGTVYNNGLPMSGDKLCVSKNATAVVDNGLPFDSAGALAADVNFDLNFVGATSLNSSITFTRASSATYFNSAGVLTTAANNVPRLDYNPATLAPRGLLIEEQRTNLVLQSETLQTTWSPAASSVSANVTVAPSGTTTADKLVEDGTTATHVLQQFLTFANATAYTMTGYFKAAERSWCWMFLPASVFTTLSGAYFNLGAGTVGSTISTGVTATIQPVGNGWYRCAITKTSTAAASGNTGFGVATGDNVNSYTGDGTSGVFAWGLQLEAGAFPTSYIPTTTAAATRSADVASVNTLSPWFNSASGTLFAEVQRPSSVSNNGAMAGVNDGSTSNRLQTRIDGATTNTNFIALAGAVNYAASFTFISGGVNKAALAYETNNVNSAGNGVVGVTDTSEVLPTGLTKLDLGQVTGAGVLNGWLRRVSYFPQRLANAELQSLTS